MIMVESLFMMIFIMVGMVHYCAEVPYQLFVTTKLARKAKES
jgi:hypothetical protein